MLKLYFETIFSSFFFASIYLLVMLINRIIKCLPFFYKFITNLSNGEDFIIIFFFSFSITLTSSENFYFSWVYSLLFVSNICFLFCYLPIRVSTYHFICIKYICNRWSSTLNDDVVNPCFFFSLEERYNNNWFNVALILSKFANYWLDYFSSNQNFLFFIVLLLPFSILLYFCSHNF